MTTATVGHLKYILSRFPDDMPLHATQGPLDDLTVLLPVELFDGALRITIIAKPPALRRVYDTRTRS